VPETAAPERESDESESAITLGLLDAVHADGQRSQRSLASDLGVALGLTNAYLKRCIRKGWIKARQAPANRYAYYLTPHGFAEKSRLTAQYLRNSLQFYRQARNEMDELLGECVERGWTRLALGGRGDLAEIAILCALHHEIEIAGLIDEGNPDDTFLRYPVTPALAALGAVDAVIVTDLGAPQRRFEAMRAEIAPKRVLAPPLLKVSPRFPRGETS
jgi:DNA-binding MarR family transcriptional regulator